MEIFLISRFLLIRFISRSFSEQKCRNRIVFLFSKENGNVVRETDKREEIYFEKGQTKQLVEQWKSKQLSPERDIVDGQTSRDGEILEQGSLRKNFNGEHFYENNSNSGKAKNLVEMWTTIDKENSPPTSRRAPRAMTPPADDARRLSTSNEVCSDELFDSTKNEEEKIPIESGHAKAIRERFRKKSKFRRKQSRFDFFSFSRLLQSAESATKRSSRQITPPPLSSEEVRRYNEKKNSNRSADRTFFLCFRFEENSACQVTNVQTRWKIRFSTKNFCRAKVKRNR